jgi:hypothetical protein
MDLHVAQPVPQAQLVVCLKFVPMAGSTDALKVFAAVWVAGPQSPDKPRRHDMVYMAADASLFEIHSTRQYLTRPM